MQVIGCVRFEVWLGGRDLNPDTVVQSHVSYRWTTSQCWVSHWLEVLLLQCLTSAIRRRRIHRRYCIARLACNDLATFAMLGVLPHRLLHGRSSRLRACWHVAAPLREALGERVRAKEIHALRERGNGRAAGHLDNKCDRVIACG
jgi:hypothetical protein